MYKSKRSLKVYEAPLGLNSKQQIPRIQLQGQWLKALGYHVGDKIDVQCTNDTIINEFWGHAIFIDPDTGHIAPVMTDYDAEHRTYTLY